jgi:hypothetical protein
MTIIGAAERLQRTLQEHNMLGAATVVIDRDEWERFEWVLRREIEPFMLAHPNTRSKMYEIKIGKIVFRREPIKEFGQKAE